MSAPSSVLLIKPGSLGDIVHALPSVTYLRRAWPEVRISWIVDRRWRELLEGVPGLDRLVEFPREHFRGPGGWARSVRWFRSLRCLRPDLALDLQGLMRSALMARASRAPICFGGSDAREGAFWLYNGHAKVDPHAHAVDRYRAILQGAGIDTQSAPVFPLGPGTLPDLDLPAQFLLLHPFARGHGKSWDSATLRRFCSAWQERGGAACPIVLVGHGQTPSDLPEGVINLLGQTSLGQFIGLARKAQWVVSVDSGPAHIAAALHDRVLVIHTWSDPRRVGPYNEQAWIWQGGNIRRQNLNPCSSLSSSQPFNPHAATALADWLAEQLSNPSSFPRP